MESLAKARSRLWNMPSASLRELPLTSLLVGSFFFVGLSPFASGTVGSAVAAVFYYTIPSLHNVWILLGLIILCFWAGVVASNRIVSQSADHDPGIIVIDEVVGQWLALMTTLYAGDLFFTIAAFVLFRIFDVLKVYPASRFEKKIGGVAVMFDDVIAGVYANLGAHIITYFYYSVAA